MRNGSPSSAGSESVVELWLRKDWAGTKRDDAMACRMVKDDLAKSGYILDRLKQSSAQEHPAYWQYVLPVMRVTS